ncbi:MAG: AsmA-like C-terminal region-containing protein [Albidovulum sp.]
MTKTEDQRAKPTRIMRAKRGGIWLILSFVVALVVLGVVGLSATGKVIPMPDWAVTRIEARANKVLAGAATARIVAVDLLVDDHFVPHVRLSGVELYSPRGARIAVLPELLTTLKPGPVLSGRVEPKTLTLKGARIALRRLSDGSLDLDMGSDAATIDTALGPAAAINAIDEAFAQPVLRDIDSIIIDGLELGFADMRSGRSWSASDGGLTFRQDAERIGIDISLTLAEEGRPPAYAQLTFNSVKGSPEATLEARVTDVSARDLAAQSPALAVLGALNAPISGAIRSSVDAEGRFGALQATLDIGAGALQPNPDTKPVPFDRARLEMEYAPEAGLLTVSDISLDSRALHVAATAKAWVKGIEGGLPSSLVGQVQITDLKADPEGIFTDPVAITQGAVDFRLRLDPFTLDLGQMVLVDGDAGRISARGMVQAEPTGWAVSLDVAVNEIESDRLMALWPVAAVPKTRAWLQENVATSALYDVKSAFRVSPDQEPRFTLGYAYRDTEVRVIRTLPPIQNGAGYATITDNAYTLVVDRGHVIAPSGGTIDVAGSVMRIPDLRIKPAPAEVTLRTRSTIPAALSLLDQPPFQFLSKAGRTPDIADGQAEVEAVLRLVLAKRIAPGDVKYEVNATLSDVSSDRIVPGRLLTAGVLQLTANPRELRIFGPATLSGIPIEASWRQGLAPSDKGKSRVFAQVELSPRFLEAFSITLPEGAVRGTGQAAIDITLDKDQDAQFKLSSDLAGLTLSIPEIGWSKPATVAGRLDVRGRLGKPAAIDRLELEGNGLSVAGKVILRGDGTLDLVRLGTAKLGGWFDGAVELQGRGAGQPVAVVVDGGSIDLRRATFGATGSQQAGAPLAVTLDRLRVTEGISLTGFRGTFDTKAGLSGGFSGSVNGAAQVQGQVEPVGNRSAFRIRAEDAGAALRAAGIYDNAVGGALDLQLRQVGGPGNYAGSAGVTSVRVTGASALAELLNAISVVGLLNQLNGAGILFSNVTADLRITPDQVEISNGAATGPSLGVSAAGLYATGTQSLDIQGTISPIYALNGVGQIFSKKGEGLFGFNYSMTGSAADPDISVNPLSILTPGMFRNIFRSNPPELDQ